MRGGEHSLGGRQDKKSISSIVILYLFFLVRLRAANEAFCIAMQIYTTRWFIPPPR
jgi:hypothetical protein